MKLPIDLPKPICVSKAKKRKTKRASTYIRKYYLIRRVKAAGFNLTKKNDLRVYWIRPDQQEAANNNQYLKELMAKHSYGVQVKNPL